MVWNYRLVSVNNKNTNYEDSIGIYEVYYDEDMNPTSRTEQPCKLLGETFDDVLGDWSKMEGAFKKDVLSDDLFEDAKPIPRKEFEIHEWHSFSEYHDMDMVKFANEHYVLNAPINVNISPVHCYDWVSKQRVISMAKQLGVTSEDLK